MGQSARMLAQPIRTLAAAAVGVSYTPIGAPLQNFVRILIFKNLTNEDLMFSYTGTTDHEVIPSGGFLLLDVTSDRINTVDFYVTEGTQLYVRQLGTPPTTGDVWISAYYAAQTP